MSDNSGHDPFAPGEPQQGAASAPQMSPSAYGYGSSGTVPQNFGQQNSGQQSYLGILSLIFPFVGLSLVGIIMGHLGLSAVKKGQANNHGVALAGTIISWVFTVLSVLGILTVFALPAYLNEQSAVETSAADPQFDPSAGGAQGGESATPSESASPTGSAPATDPTADDGSVAFSVLEIGDCIADPYANVADDAAVSVVEVVDCAEPHFGEVYAVGPMEADTYVEDDIYAQADDLCFFAYENFMGISYADSMYYYEPYYPSAEGWNVGDRETTCVVTSFASDTVGTLQDSGL